MVLVALGKDDVSQRAIEFMSNKDYKLISQTESSITFEDGKDFNKWIMILLVLFLLLGAIIYYLLAKRHNVTVTVNRATVRDYVGAQVECSTNSSKSLRDSHDFLRSLPKLAE